MPDESTKPYFLRALYEWCVDQGYTPYIAVMVDQHTVVPRSYVRDGQIVLNIGPEACNQLQMGNELITFQARFNGVAQGLSVPVANVAAIYARENGQGMGFEVSVAGEEGTTEDAAVEPAAAPSVVSERESEPAPASASPSAAGKGHLKVVK